MDNYTSLLSIPSSPDALVVTRYLETSFDVSGILAAYSLGDSSPLLALWIIPYAWYSSFTSLVIDLLILPIQGVRLHAIVS